MDSTDQLLQYYRHHLVDRLDEHVQAYVAADKPCFICNISHEDQAVLQEMVREIQAALQETVDPAAFVLPDLDVGRKFASFHPQYSEALARNLRRLYVLLTDASTTAVVLPGSRTYAFLEKVTRRGYQSPLLSAVFMRLRSVPMDADVDDQFKQAWVRVIEAALAQPPHSATTAASGSAATVPLSATVLPEERRFLHEVCAENQWPIMYCWQALALWIRIRPHVFAPDRGGGRRPSLMLCRGILKVCLELAIIYHGPQDVVDDLPLRQKGATPAAIYRFLFGKTMPNYKAKKMTGRCLLHIEIFLRLLDARI